MCMPVSRAQLLAVLPPYQDKWVTVAGQQDVHDIIQDMLRCHSEFAGYYDKIAPFFDCGNVRDTCELLFNFCKDEIQYKEETEDLQTTALPAGILTRGHGDCKHYASFIGGVLGALQRRGEKIDWYYCFASYDPLESTPYHVFVVVMLDGAPFYVDPTPGANLKTPVWVDNRYPVVKEKDLKKLSGMAVGKSGELVTIGTTASNGVLMAPPAWYSAYLPLFYNPGNGIYLHGSAVANYTDNDVLDLLLYYQTIVGYNRTDYTGAISAAWKHSDNSDSGYNWAVNALKNGPGSNNWANVSFTNYTIDGAVYSAMQQRYIVNELKTKPWLGTMQATGGGIDLMTLPFATDTEIARPSFYPNYLPSLFISAGAPGQYPAGHLDTKPKLRTGKSSGWTDYTIQPSDVAALMLYAQPVIDAGPSPYPTNWYINDNVNGAEAFRYKITLGFSSGFTNAQIQTWAITGNMFIAPVLDADPFASGFTKTLESIVSAAISYFTTKIPGGAALTTASKYAAGLSGGQVITGGPVPPGVFSAAVFAAADSLQNTLVAQATTKKYLLIGLFAALVLGWYYWPEIKKKL
jgi:hypothetical protein